MKDIPVRTRFGPYEGDVTMDLEKAHATGYSWQVTLIYCLI